MPKKLITIGITLVAIVSLLAISASATTWINMVQWPKSTFTAGQTVDIYTQIKKNDGSAVNNYRLQLLVTYPNGQKESRSTTFSMGPNEQNKQVYINWKVPPYNAVKGQYQACMTIVQNGNSQCSPYAWKVA
jgi:hypothetical protein